MPSSPSRRIRSLRAEVAARVREHPVLEASVKRQHRRWQGVDSMLAAPRKRVRRRWGAAWLEWGGLRGRALTERRGVHGTARIEWDNPGNARLAVGELLGPGEGEVMIRSIVSSVSMGTERATLLGEPNMAGAWPRRPGYSLAGVVEAVGAGVDTCAPGDLVAAKGPHASRVVVPADRVFRVPERVSAAEASFLQLGIIVLHGIVRSALAPGERVVVLGRGPIGQLATQLARARGAAEVVSVAPTRSRVTASLPRFAQRVVVTSEQGDEVLDDLGADVTFEATGAPDAVFDAVRATRDGGRVVLLGSPTGITRGFDPGLLADRRVTLLGAHIDSLPLRDESARLDHRSAGEQFLAAVACGDLDVRALVSVEVDPVDAGVFYRQMASGAQPWLGALLRWDRVDADPVRTFASLPPLEAVAGRDLRGNPDARGTTQQLNLGPAMAARPRTPAARGRVGFAVVGVGGRGAEVAARVDLAHHAALVRVVDVNPDHAREAGNSLRVPWTTTLEDALTDERVDAVFVATPHHLHASPALLAIGAGKHVVVDKPLSHDVASARTIVDAARDADVLLSTWLGFRYRPRVHRARQLVDAGALGELVGANLTHYLHHPPGYWERGGGWKASRATSGGGVLMMNGIHHLDTLLWLAGQPVTEVYARQYALDPHAAVEDSVAMVLTFANGAVATVNFSSALQGLAFQTVTEHRLWGRDGHLSLADPVQYWSSREIDGRPAGRWHSMRPLPRLLPPDVELLERFSVAVLRGDPPEITGDDGLALQLVIEAAYASIDKGVPVHVDDPAGEVA
jgi:predicted dehydrogenase/threonine dehydrogenase-like Zn-dependent dehydrogenase